MKRNYRFASALLTAMLALSAPALAHDGNGQGDWNGGPQQHMDGEHHHWMLSKEKRDLLHKTMKTTMEKDKPLFEQMKKLHKQQHDILKAQNFDSQAFLSTNEQITKLHDQIHADHVEAFASIAGKFTPKEREMIIRHFGHHHMHGHDGHHDGHHITWEHERVGGNGLGHDNNGWRERSAEDIAPAQPAADTLAYPPYPWQK